MIDFKNASFFKLKMVSNEDFADQLLPMLSDGENILSTYKGVRDGIVFTNKRIIAINVQGVTGKKKDFSSLPYSKLQAFSVETAGTIDLDSELELYYSGLGRVKFDFTGASDIIINGHSYSLYRQKAGQKAEQKL